jgi:hypothetical protein
MRIALSAKRLSVYIRVQKGNSYTIKLWSPMSGEVIVEGKPLIGIGANKFFHDIGDALSIHG